MALTNAKVADVPLNRTDVTPVKLDPKIATDVPTGPLFGDRLVILGPPVTVNVPLLVTVPAEVVTEILPVVALVGTVVLIRVELATVNVAPVPLNRTALTLVNPVPLIVTAVPALPLVGEKLEIAQSARAGDGEVDAAGPRAGRGGHRDMSRRGATRDGGLDVARCSRS